MDDADPKQHNRYDHDDYDPTEYSHGRCSTGLLIRRTSNGIKGPRRQVPLAKTPDAYGQPRPWVRTLVPLRC